MRCLLLAPLLSLCALVRAQEPVAPLSADAIMARVAANQDRSEAERAHFLYVQHAHIASRKGDTVRCEETTDTRVTPTPTGSNRKLLKLEGRRLNKNHYITYNELRKPDAHDNKKPDDTKPAADAAKSSGAAPSDDTAEVHNDDINISLDGDDTLDRDLVESMRDDLTTSRSKDGINPNLFPLASKEQPSYRFSLLGREPRNGRDCYHIAFRPKDKDDYGWKGDAWIDAAAFQPVVVRTAMARKIPFAVRALLGTNIPGLGFTIIYAPAASGDIWFPTSFGTEFKIHVLYFFHRDIVFSAENRDFQKTHVTSQIVDAPNASK